MKRKMINLGALAVIALGGAALTMPAYAAVPDDAEIEATCTIGNVTLEGDACTSDGTTCKCV
jgi:hypothetical protein